MAECHGLLSSSQEGFRPYKNTIRQLQMALNAIEDAKSHDQNIYALWVDFSSAFNTIDHDKLLQIMYDLGFPDGAINAVKGIYSHSQMRVITPHGRTAPIPIERGTIQGDTLSPFLFLVFLEPLLRWLQSGGRGYEFGCLDGHTRQVHRCGASA